MKSQRWQSGIFVVLLLVAAATGQTRPGDLNAKVPFPFVVANETLPPGHYIIAALSEKTLLVQNLLTHRPVLVLTATTVRADVLESAGKLVFHRYGNTYFLAEVWVPANDIGRQLFRSGKELETAQREVGTTVAVLPVPNPK